MTDRTRDYLALPGIILLQLLRLELLWGTNLVRKRAEHTTIAGLGA